jgi:Tfp pilus assembly protein FimV
VQDVQDRELARAASARPEPAPAASRLREPARAASPVREPAPAASRLRELTRTTSPRPAVRPHGRG